MLLASAAALILSAPFAEAANGPPLASDWNIAATGSAAASGDLAFRITPGDGSNPVDITVPVMSGAAQDSVARSIGRALSSQLPRDRYSVELGENGNVLVSDPHGEPNFSLELVDSDIENVRVTVQSTVPAASPTVPRQATPADLPVPPTPRSPGDAVPPVTPPAPDASPHGAPASTPLPTI